MAAAGSSVCERESGGVARLTAAHLSALSSPLIYMGSRLSLCLANGPRCLREKYMVTQQHVANLSEFGDAVHEISFDRHLMLPRPPPALSLAATTATFSAAKPSRPGTARPESWAPHHLGSAPPHPAPPLASPT
ncbi:hypothetical protein E2C01_085391 [Portunus trituberculatus]|uniref:Uncharacterized protein n=1 Tax=Portunus trituberculatus TaxID=210409 RepID=A0A5B7J6P9_PORTR|nr:hypothetical protein [Portunus trituberculatus]